MINKINSLKKYFNKNNFKKEFKSLEEVIARISEKKKPLKEIQTFYFASLKKNSIGQFNCINFEYEFSTSDENMIKDLEYLKPDEKSFIFFPKENKDSRGLDKTDLIPLEILKELKNLGWRNDQGFALGVSQTSFEEGYGSYCK
tara:strand:+ start:859 stop:1290 length:432 start_codon:yes stop_codon:yes gene_type:complete